VSAIVVERYEAVDAIQQMGEGLGSLFESAPGGRWVLWRGGGGGGRRLGQVVIGFLGQAQIKLGFTTECTHIVLVRIAVPSFAVMCHPCRI
jgi:hypothetical protein